MVIINIFNETQRFTDKKIRRGGREWADALRRVEKTRRMLQVHLANFITHIQQLLNKSSKYSDLWEENLHTPDSLIASAMRHGIAQLLNTAVESLGRNQTRSSGERETQGRKLGEWPSAGARGYRVRVPGPRPPRRRQRPMWVGGSLSVTRPRCPGPGSAHRAGPAPRPRPPPPPAPRRLPRNPSREAGTARRGRGRRAGPGPQGLRGAVGGCAAPTGSSGVACLGRGSGGPGIGTEEGSPRT